MNKVYEIVTERIIQQLQRGIVPWHKPWHSAGNAPRNFVTSKPYRGINIFLLGAQGRACPDWLTFNQAKAKGGHVRKGEAGTLIVFWRWLERKGGQQVERFPVLRYYTVFNLEQCEGISTESVKRDVPALPSCESVVAAMPKAPAVEHGTSGAFYRPSTDTVCMPHRVKFDAPEFYYSTLFHELTHATGHESRLNRRTLADLCPFGSTNYSREELVAEMGAAMLCATTGIENAATQLNTVSYIDNWLRELGNDSKLVIQAAAQAQRAADFILGRTENEKGDEQ